MTLINTLIELFARLPGIGPKSAQRLVYQLLKSDDSYNRQLGTLISELKSKIVRCSRCNYFTEEDPCAICSDLHRDHSKLCVVASQEDVEQLERCREYNGEYHVINGYISPLDGIGPEEIGGMQLYNRIKEKGHTEVIIATNPTIEGETTALYLAKLLQQLQIKITRPAQGLPIGGDLGYADRFTIAQSLRDRTPIAL